MESTEILNTKLSCDGLLFKCNNLLQYILGEADDIAGKISKPPG